MRRRSVSLVIELASVALGLAAVPVFMYHAKRARAQSSSTQKLLAPTSPSSPATAPTSMTKF